MAPNKYINLVLFISIITGAIALDLNMQNLYNISDAIFSGIIIYYFVWTTSTIITEILLKKEKNKQEKITTDNKTTNGVNSK